MRYMAYGGPWPIGHRCSLNLSHQATGISWHAEHEYKGLHGKKGEKKGKQGETFLVRELEDTEVIES